MERKRGGWRRRERDDVPRVKKSEKGIEMYRWGLKRPGGGSVGMQEGERELLEGIEVGGGSRESRQSLRRPRRPNVSGYHLSVTDLKNRRNFRRQLRVNQPRVDRTINSRSILVRLANYSRVNEMS